MADNCSTVSKLFYIRSDGDNDTIHYLFDYTQKPSLVVLMTAKDSIIQVNYSDNLENTIKFTTSLKYTFASIFNNVSK